MVRNLISHLPTRSAMLLAGIFYCQDFHEDPPQGEFSASIKNAPMLLGAVLLFIAIVVATA